VLYFVIACQVVIVVSFPYYPGKNINNPASPLTYLDQTWVGWQDTRSSSEACVEDQ